MEDGAFRSDSGGTKREICVSRFLYPVSTILHRFSGSVVTFPSNPSDPLKSQEITSPTKYPLSLHRHLSTPPPRQPQDLQKGDLKKEPTPHLPFFSAPFPLRLFTPRQSQRSSDHKIPTFAWLCAVPLLQKREARVVSAGRVKNEVEEG